MIKKAFTVIYEDNHLLIVNKIPGLLSQGDKTGDKSLVDIATDYIREKYDKPGNVFCGLVHRLDRPTSGLVILARTSKGLERMTELFRERKITKVYWAVVRNKPEKAEGRLTHYLVKDPEKNIVSVFDREVTGSMKAELKYKLMGKVNHHYLLEVQPLTGRPHQIRAQLAHIGCPIRGDVKYGYPKPNAGGNINLHARRVDFIHPIKKTPLIAMAGLPDDPFWLEYLELDTFEANDKRLDYLFSA